MLGGGGQRRRNEYESSHSYGTCERESICPQSVNQVDKEHRGAEQVAAAGAEARGQSILNAARGKKQHHQKVKSEGRERVGESAAAVALPGGVQRSGQSQQGPQACHGERPWFPRGIQSTIRTQPQCLTN